MQSSNGSEQTCQHCAISIPFFLKRAPIAKQNVVPYKTMRCNRHMLSRIFYVFKFLLHEEIVQFERVHRYNANTRIFLNE